MSVIYKYPLELVDEQVVRVPCGPSKIQLLHVDLQGDQMCLWARVDPGYPERDVRVFMRGTGHPMGAAELGVAYLGTVMTHGQQFVWHFWAQTSERVVRA